MSEFDKKDIKEMKGRIDELFEYETAVTDDDGEMEALTIYNAAVARLSNYYNNKIEGRKLDDRSISIS